MVGSINYHHKNMNYEGLRFVIWGSLLGSWRHLVRSYSPLYFLTRRHPDLKKNLKIWQS